MDVPSMNYLAIAVAAVAFMVLGALWYSPILFGAAWMKGIGKSKEQVAADFSYVVYVIALILSFIAAYGIARIMYWTNGYAISEAIKISVLVGVCFVLTSLGLHDRFEKRPFGLTVINVLYHLIGFVIMGIIISVWR
jgi:hypothetical protein